MSERVNAVWCNLERAPQASGLRSALRACDSVIEGSRPPITPRDEAEMRERPRRLGLSSLLANWERMINEPLV